MSRDRLLLLLVPTGEEQMFQMGYFWAGLVTQPTVYPAHRELCFWGGGGLSKCLHLLMWVNQHRHTGGVWIPNPSGRTLGPAHSSAALLWGRWGGGWGSVSGAEES